MLSIVLKDEFKDFLITSLTKHSVSPSNQYITHEFKHRLFHLKLYTTNLLTIEGEKKFDIYEKLFSLLNENNFLGMDEVGVGDFFGPTVYVSVYLNESSIEKLAHLHLDIKDSKKLKDNQIISIYAKVKDIIDYNVQIIFDRDLKSGLNSVDQKLYYHHQNFLSINKRQQVNTTVIDLFTTLNNFSKVSTKLNVSFEPSNLVLETKADSKYICVALASIIARFHFINEMNKLNKEYNFIFPYGANIKNKAKEFVSIYSKEELAKFCKTTFKTFDEL